jgi:hypothetical protein
MLPSYFESDTGSSRYEYLPGMHVAAVSLSCLGVVDVALWLVPEWVVARTVSLQFL